ncbi:hypothetical protein B0H17DRAFT_1149217 [Mycena rosella]|uniref:Uncharacterized protein n=1 Tax=Mycena rosella TaxID=1033263 RepID=A0AAD7FU09_MYCRO|nr:hypothetical protein B0H17DRAFT_1149217 [Mycena rosella]
MSVTKPATTWRTGTPLDAVPAVDISTSPLEAIKSRTGERATERCPSTPHSPRQVFPASARWIVRMRQYPGRPLQTFFDYTGRQPRRVDVQPVAEPIPATLQDYIARAARSGNRMHLCAVYVAAKEPIRMLPIRSSNSMVTDTLVAIAQAIPFCANISGLPPHVLQKTKKLIKRVNRDVVIV